MKCPAKHTMGRCDSSHSSTVVTAPSFVAPGHENNGRAQRRGRSQSEWARRHNRKQELG